MSSQLGRPLVSVVDSKNYIPETVHIEPEVAQALSLLACKRAMNSPGSIRHHERGLFGEYAYAKSNDATDAVDTNIYDYGDAGYDLEFEAGTIDVKTAGRQWNNPELQINTRQDLEADFYVLVHQLNRQCYQIIGWVPREVVQNAPTRRILHEDYADRVRAVPRDWLRPF